MNENTLARALPLYKSVKQNLVERIAKGVWKPGQLIPTEFQLADELGVSQGTVRKALDEMRVDHLLIRRQGLGTFVTAIDDDRIHFAFFRFIADDGTRHMPDSTVKSLTKRSATAAECEKLQLNRPADVWIVDRVRMVNGINAIRDRMILPAALFPKLDKIEEIPSNIYRLYAKSFSTTVRRASDKLKAVPASKSDANIFHCAVGHPLLQAERIAFGLDGKPVELRVARYLTDEFYYLCEMQ